MVDNNKLSNLRGRYSEEGLSEENVEKDPLKQFSLWMDDVLKSGYD